MSSLSSSSPTAGGRGGGVHHHNASSPLTRGSIISASINTSTSSSSVPVSSSSSLPSSSTSTRTSSTLASSAGSSVPPRPLPPNSRPSFEEANKPSAATMMRPGSGFGSNTRSAPVNVMMTRASSVSTDGPISRRPIYPNFPFSPFTSPGTSPFTRRRQFKESQRVSVERIGDNVQLNQYRLKEPIGRGSYGIVKLAYNEEDSQHYAMKILSKKKLMQKAGIFGRPAPIRSKGIGARTTPENPIDRVYREIAILKKLDHPNVVKLVEVLDDPAEDSLYLVFELLERGEVLEVPTTTPLPEEKGRKYFRDVVLGLEYLHYQKICHRDLKPSNLLLGDDDHIKIADFGVCNEFNGQDDAILTSTLGTPAFIAPEALAAPRESYSGKMADIWQLGVTLYTLVYGRVPFHDDNIIKLYEKIQSEDLVFPSRPDTTILLKCLLQKMLHKDPKQRFTLPEVKVHSWVTKSGAEPLPTEEENCTSYVEVTEDDIMNCVRSIPKLDTLILVKTMLKNHSFQHPFKRSPSAGRSGSAAPGRNNLLHVNGRSHSAPSSYDVFLERKMSLDSSGILPRVTESRWETSSPSSSCFSSGPRPYASSPPKKP